MWMASVSVLFLQGERALFLESHQNCFAWIDEWYGMTIEQIHELERQSDISLNQVKRFPHLVVAK